MSWGASNPPGGPVVAPFSAAVRVSPDPVFASAAERVEFEAMCAAYRAVNEWIDAEPSDGVRRALVGCTPSMVAGVAVKAYVKALAAGASQ